jgi:hypothetical protein
MPIQSSNPPEIATLDQWGSVNQQVPRASIGDAELWWGENLFQIGPGNLRSCWGRGPVLYTAPAGVTILRIFFGFYGNQTPPFGIPPPGRMGWMWLSNGHIVEVDLDTLATTDIGQIWEPIAPYYWGSTKVWRPRWVGQTPGEVGGVLFGSPQGLYAWDGTTLYSPGGPAPNWLTSFDVTGTGSTIMPTGLPGIYTMEVYQERLFVAGKDVISFSAPMNGADFSTAAGGGSFGYFGDKLVYSYMDLSAAAGYLFCFGDSSVDMISNIQLSGQGTPTSPYTTNFNYTNVDPQTGHGFPRPVGHWGRYFVHANGAPLHPPDTDPLAHRGQIYLLAGGLAEPIGEKMNDIYTALQVPLSADDVGNYYVTISPATIFGLRVMLVNGRFRDPFGVTRNLMLMWHGSIRQDHVWSIASQGVELTNIGPYEQDSVITPYGTDGTYLWQLFARPDPQLIKKLSTKAFRGTGQGTGMLAIHDFKRLYLELHDKSGQGAALTGTVTTRGGGIPGGVQDVAFEMVPGKIYDILPQPISAAGITAALDLHSTSPDFIIERVHVASEERTLYGA